VSFHREIDPSDARGDSLDGVPALREQRLGRSSVLATGTLACPSCDAPVAPPGPLAVVAPIACPYCAHAGVVRDFLSLTPPTRPARVVVRVIAQPSPLRKSAVRQVRSRTWRRTSST
jgi:hypothetical protein